MRVQEPPDDGLEPQALPRHVLAHPPGKYPRDGEGCEGGLRRVEGGHEGRVVTV